MFFVQGVTPEDFAASLAARQPFTVQVTLQSIYSTTPKVLMVDFRCGAGYIGGRAVDRLGMG